MITVMLPESKEDLPADPEVLKQFEAVVELFTQLISAREKMVGLVQDFQKRCAHEFENVMQFDETYCARVDGDSRGQQIYIGKKCKKCKLFVPREKGMPWFVCYKCGGKMERQPGFAHWGQIRVNVYKCQSCDHEHDTT